MLFNKHSRAFVKAVAPHNFKGIIDLNTANQCLKQASAATDNFEDGLSEALLSLNTEQQTRLLLQTLENFASLDFLYSENPYYNKEVDFEKAMLVEDLYANCLGFAAGRIENQTISEEDAKLLQGRIASQEVGYAQTLVLRSYGLKVGDREADKWTLNPDIREYKLWKHEQDSLANQADSIPEFGSDTAFLPWQYGLNDFAEMIYKLERTGAIDLKSYFDSGKTGTDLARAFCKIFIFKSKTSNPVGTLSNYISDIKQGLGRGEYDLGVLKSIGRVRGGKMDVVIPRQPEKE